MSLSLSLSRLAESRGIEKIRPKRRLERRQRHRFLSDDVSHKNRGISPPLSRDTLIDGAGSPEFIVTQGLSAVN